MAGPLGPTSQTDEGDADGNAGTGPAMLVWLAFSAAAIGLAGFAPAWVVALCVPAAGLIAWLLVTRHARAHRARIDRLAESIEMLGTPDEPAADAGVLSTPDLGSGPGTVEAEGLQRLEMLVERRSRWIDDTIVRLLESRAALRANLNAVDAPVVATDEAGRVRMLNRAAERLFDARDRDAAGRPLEELITNNALLELHARAERGEACRQRIRLTLAGQSRIHEVSAIPVRLNIADVPARVTPRGGVVLTLRDVHELAQTLQLRTDFAANASHELRTPIASIRTAIETIRGAADDDPVMRNRVVGMIENNVARLEEMVHDLLDLSRLESDEQTIRVEPVDGLEMARALREMFADSAEKRHVSLDFRIDPALSEMRTDRKLVLLILRNLIDNAIKFAFEGTTVRITGSVVRANGTGVAAARFSVEDRGVGIPLKHQERIFERFYQVDESRARLGGRRGSGLGLAIVRHALRRLDGEIDVDSIWQVGTTMTVTLPRCVRTAEPDPLPESQPPSGA